MKHFNSTFRRIKAAYDRKPSPLLCKQGFYAGCPVIKLQKPAWTNDPISQLPNHTGIFFSLWLDESSRRQNRALYNIHALKLRSLKPYRLTSIAFAREFRAAFLPLQADWPNVRTDFGPQTLMQGWIGLTAFERDALALLTNFHRVAPLIDDLLDAARRRHSPAATARAKRA